MFKTTMALSTAVLLSACATTVNHRSDAVDTPSQTGLPIRSVAITYSPSGADDLKDNAGFEQSKLLTSIDQHLTSKQLLETSAPRGDSLEIQITAVRYRSTFNAVMWGFMAGSDNVRGEVYLRDPSGKLLSHFEVYAMYALGGLGAGWKGERWSYLYNKFGDAVADNLAPGKPTHGAPDTASR